MTLEFICFSQLPQLLYFYNIWIVHSRFVGRNSDDRSEESKRHRKVSFPSTRYEGRLTWMAPGEGGGDGRHGPTIANVTVATGNSRHYQPLCRIARRHRRKSSNLLFSTFFHASRSSWSHRTILPPTRSLFLSVSLSLSLSLSFSLFSCTPLFSSLWQGCPIQRLDENGLGPFPPSKKEARKGGRRWPEARKKADASTTPTYLANILRSSRCTGSPAVPPSILLGLPNDYIFSFSLHF